MSDDANRNRRTARIEKAGLDTVSAAEILSRTVADQAVTALGLWNLEHYIEAGDEATRDCLDRLQWVVVESLRTHRLDPVLAHADRIAEERFRSSFGLAEVQTAFNVLEEALWRRILLEFDEETVPDVLGLVTTIIGACRDRFARRYVELLRGGSTKTPETNALFAGTQSGQEAGHV